MYKIELVQENQLAGQEFPLTWYQQISLTPDTHAVLIKGDCQDILAKLENLKG